MKKAKSIKLVPVVPVLFAVMAVFSLAQAFSFSGNDDSRLEGLSLVPEPVHNQTASEILARLDEIGRASCRKECRSRGSPSH